MELKLTVVLAGAVLLGLAMVCQTCQTISKIDANAPVVETCVKHPVTRSPIMGTH